MTKNIDASMCLMCEDSVRPEFGSRISHGETPPHTLPTPLFNILKKIWLQPRGFSQGGDRADRKPYGGRRQEKCREPVVYLLYVLQWSSRGLRENVVKWSLKRRLFYFIGRFTGCKIGVRNNNCRNFTFCLVRSTKCYNVTQMNR